MKITYFLTEEDYLQFNLDYLARQSRMRLGFYYVIGGLMSVFGWLGIIIGIAEWRSMPHLFLLFYTALAIMGTNTLWNVWPTRLRRRVSHAAKSIPGLIGEHTITITHDGFTTVSEVGKTEITWRGVIDLALTANLVLLFINPTMAHIIPRRAFVGDEEAKLFYETAFSYWLSAKQGHKPTKSRSGRDAWPPAPRLG